MADANKPRMVENGNGRIAQIIFAILSTLIVSQQYEISSLRSWQDDYGRGHIPAPGIEAEIAETRQKFVEVETQFRAFRDRMMENESHFDANITRNIVLLDALESRMNAAEAMLARLEEHAPLAVHPRVALP